MTSSSLRACLGAVGVLAAASCVSVLPEQPKPQAVYPLPQPQSFARLATNVVIREPDAPRLYAGRTITSQAPDGGLQVLPNVQWADRATRMFQTTLLEAFTDEGEGLAVDDVTGVSGQYELYWRVSKFTLDAGEGVCKLQLTLLDGRSREPIAQEMLEASSEALGEDDMARARALGDAGRQCIEKAAAVIAEEAVDRSEAESETGDEL